MDQKPFNPSYVVFQGKKLYKRGYVNCVGKNYKPRPPKVSLRVLKKNLGNILFMPTVRDIDDIGQRFCIMHFFKSIKSGTKFALEYQHTELMVYAADSFRSKYIELHRNPDIPRLKKHVGWSDGP